MSCPASHRWAVMSTAYGSHGYRLIQSRISAGTPVGAAARPARSTVGTPDGTTFGGALVQGLSHSHALFVIARLAGGMAVGAASVLSPAYISEVAPASIRGRLTSITAQRNEA